MRSLAASSQIVSMIAAFASSGSEAHPVEMLSTMSGRYTHPVEMLSTMSGSDTHPMERFPIPSGRYTYPMDAIWILTFRSFGILTLNIITE